MTLSRLFTRLGRLFRPWAKPPADAPYGYSLFGKIIDWLLLPLLLLWPISILLTYDAAAYLANQPYDQALGTELRDLARHVSQTPDGNLTLTATPISIKTFDGSTELSWQIITNEGQLLGGSANWPTTLEDENNPRLNVLQFRDHVLHGVNVRIASLTHRFQHHNKTLTVLTQLAEPRELRNHFALRIALGVLLPQLIMMPLALYLIWFGLTRGIAPLTTLQRWIYARRPGDLTPISLNDIPTEIRPLIIAFNELLTRVEQLLHAQQQFVADAAHQMRTPLTGLKMQIELATSEPDPEQARHAMLRATQGAERASRLLNQLLSLARAEASSESGQTFGPLDWTQAIRDTLADCVPLALQKNIELSAQLPETATLVFGNVVLLNELLLNLCDNAIKYSPAGGQVCVSLQQTTANWAQLQVTDNGPGIALNERQRVFQRFYRVLDNKAEGSGLGLAIVREISELHGGNVHIIDPPTHTGICIEVSLPRFHVTPDSNKDLAT